MSGTQVSAWQTPNELLTSMETPALVQRNQLMNQEAQQTINANEMEQISRASNWVISQDPENKDPAKQAAAYGAAVRAAAGQQLREERAGAVSGLRRHADDGAAGHAEQRPLSADAGQRLGQRQQDRRWWRSRCYGPARRWRGRVLLRQGDGTPADRGSRNRAARIATALNYVARADPTAYARGATASGKYQFVNSTWREGMQLAGLDPAQYATARDAPEEVQDQVFDAVYAKYGTKPWQKGPKDWVKDEQGSYQLATVRPPPGSPGGAPVTAAAAPPGGGVAARYPGAVQAAGPAVGTAPAAPPGAAAAPPAPVTTIEPETGLPMLSGPPNQVMPGQPNGPPAAPAVAAPAATAPAATAPPPPAAPQQPPFSRPAPVNPATGLRPDQEQELNGLLPMASRSREGQAQWVARKQQMIQQNQADQRQYETQVNTWQNQQGEAADRAQRLQLSQQTAAREEAARADAAEKAARERRLAADPIQGTDDKANADRLLFRYADKILDGSATTEERRLYAQAAQYYLKPQMQWISDSNDPTKSIMVPVPGQLPQGFPHPSYKPGEQPAAQPPAATKSDVKPLPENERKVLLETATRLEPTQ